MLQAVPGQGSQQHLFLALLHSRHPGAAAIAPAAGGATFVNLGPATC